MFINGMTGALVFICRIRGYSHQEKVRATVENIKEQANDIKE